MMLWRMELTSGNVVDMLHRPYDKRYVFYSNTSDGILARPRSSVMRELMEPGNVGLIVTRGVEMMGPYNHVFCSDVPLSLHSVTGKEGNHVFPLFLSDVLVGRGWRILCALI